MTEVEQLETLRAHANWARKKLDALAWKAAASGRLREAVAEADRLMGERADFRSNSSVTVPAAQVPITDFSHFENRSNLWCYRLSLELYRVLGLNVPLGEWDDAC